MQDQGRRLIIAVALTLGVLWVWQAVMGKKEEPPKKAVATGSAGSAGSAAGPLGPPVPAGLIAVRAGVRLARPSRESPSRRSS